MAAPATPNNFIVQQGNGNVYLSWNISAGSTSYDVLRSVDNVTFAVIASPTLNNYLDTTVVVGTQYFYQVLASNGLDSQVTASQTVIPTLSGVESLLSLRQQSQQRADRVNSNFVTTAEWNDYINQSYFELYDLLKNVYEDWFFAQPYIFTTDGSDSYVLPDDFYNLMGVDCGLSPTGNAFVSIHKYDFIERNRYIYPNLTSTFFGVFNMRYRLMGNRLHFIPTPSANQIIRVWYVPRMVRLLQDTDMADGVSGWMEYIIVDSAIKALQKEESDVSVLMAQKEALKRRIEETAINRDIGQPDTISDTRAGRNGSWGNGMGDGSFGGY